MSRSRKKAPVCYNACGQSQKRGKQFSNRKFRSMERKAMAKNCPDRAPKKQYEAIPKWDLGCDGHQRCFRSSPELQERIMRK